MQPVSPPRPAFYASARTGAVRDLVALLHAPYTLLHLSFVVLGAAFAPTVRLERLAAAFLAFFLAVGVAAHFLDELRGRPMRTRLGAGTLLAGAVLALAGACAIGLWGLLVVSAGLLVFIASGAFIVVAYNLELAGGLFHGDRTFAAFWGAFPFITTYWVMDESLGWPALPGALGCYAVAQMQRALSTPARLLRRRVARVEGTLTLHDGESVGLTRELLLRTPERGLRALCAAVPALALAALLARL
jgi:hypothetical protein